MNYENFETGNQHGKYFTNVTAGVHIVIGTNRFYFSTVTPLDKYINFDTYAMLSKTLSLYLSHGAKIEQKRDQKGIRNNDEKELFDQTVYLLTCEKTEGELISITINNNYNSY